jgi:ABC-type glycerol-3-phosphate transport system substrate-binding protein
MTEVRAMRKMLLLFFIIALSVGFSFAGQPEATTIRFWMFGSEDKTTIDFLNDMKAKFLKTSGINVDWKIIPWQDAQTRLMLAVTSGDAPDISMVGATWVEQFISTGAIANLAPYLDKFGGEKAFVPGAWLSAGVKGNIIAPPWDGDTRGLIYRQDTFDSLGLKPPRTWDELIAAAKKIQQATGQKYPIGMTMQGGDGVYDLAWLTYLDGGNLVSPDGKTAMLTSPSVVKAATFMTDLITKYKVVSPGATNEDFNQVADDFLHGQTSIILGEMFIVYAQAKQAAGWDFGKKWNVALPPTSSRNLKQVSMVLPDNLMIFKSTKHFQEALKFMAFLLDEPQEVEYTQLYGLPPTTVAAYKDKSFSSPYWKAQYQIMLDGRFTPIVSGWGVAEVNIATALANMMSAAVGGNVTQETIMFELEKANKAFQAGIDAGKRQ